MPLSSSAEITKYVAAPTIAASAQATPTGVEVGARHQVEHEHQAERGEPGADQGQRAGALAVAQPHASTTTAAGAVYSISSAGPTCMCATAEK